MVKHRSFFLLILMIGLVSCNSTQKLTILPTSIILEKGKVYKYKFWIKEDNNLSSTNKVFVEDSMLVRLLDSKIEAVLKEKTAPLKVSNPDNYRLLLHLKLQSQEKIGGTSLKIVDASSNFQKEMKIEVR